MNLLSPMDLMRGNFGIAAITSGTIATDTLSGAIDTLGYEFAMLVITTGTMGAETVTISLHSSTAAAGTYAVITGCTTTVANADDNSMKIGVVRLEGKNRYLKVVHNAAAGGVTGCNYHAHVLLFGPKDTVQQNAGTSNEAAAGSESYEALVFNVK